MADEQAPKPGYKTTEFWITVVVTLAGLAMASGYIQAGSNWDRAIGLVMSTLAALGYSKNRTDAKG